MAEPPEFRRQTVGLVRAGRTPEELAKEFQPSAQSIRTWVRHADLDDGRRQDGLTSAEKDERRRHSANGQLSPPENERRHMLKNAQDLDYAAA